jgi:hypothetical protein
MPDRATWNRPPRPVTVVVSTVSYDDTAELVRLSGTSPGATKGFALLRGWGAASLTALAVDMPGDTGINVLAEDYAISAGNPPTMITLLDGGQSAALVTTRLGESGVSAGELGSPSGLHAS